MNPQSIGEKMTLTMNCGLDIFCDVLQKFRSLEYFVKVSFKKVNKLIGNVE